MFNFCKRKPSSGGQYINFEKKSSSSRKRSWRSCGNWKHVQRVMENLEDCCESSESTTDMSTSNVPSNEDSFNISSCSSINRAASCSDITCSFSLINHSRKRWNSQLQKLKRCNDLDSIAKKHAEAMAHKRAVFHQNASELCESLQKEPQRRLGENVVSGNDPLDMHMQMLELVTNYTNMVDARYQEVGIAEARGSNGRYYLCVIFRG